MEEIESSISEDPLGCSPDNWNNWKWQIANSITELEQVKEFIPEKDFEKLKECKIPLRITPYYYNVIKNSKELQKTVIPSINELVVSEGEEEDSLAEEEQSPIKGLVHRYPNRVLFLTTDICSNFCRYCTRSRMFNNEIQIPNWEEKFEYIRNHPEIFDVILSGGDVLMLSDEKIEYLLKNLRDIPTVGIIRIGSKMPVVAPQRITDNLVNMIKKYHPVYMSIHCTHPDEITEEVKEACNKIANAGIVMRSQTVLLKDVNNNAETLKKLYNELLKIRISPYYLYVADYVIGTNHFRTSVREGIEIIEKLRGWTSGYAVPTLIVDLKDGMGKVEVSPTYLLDEEKMKFRNYKGKEIQYFE